MNTNPPNPTNPTNSFNLFTNKYDLIFLAKNMEHFSQFQVLKTQHLDAPFCAKYILNEDYALYNEDTYIGWSDVMKYQRHIKPIELYNAVKAIQIQKK